MKKLIVLLVYISLNLFSVSVCSYEILTIGDSITRGRPYVQYDPNGARTEEGYQPYLEDFLSQNNTPSAVYNWGVSGETTIGGLSRIKSVLDSRFSHFMLIMEGANDLYWGISSSTTATNIGVMIDRVLEKEVIPIVGTITPNTKTTGYDNLIQNDYNPKIVVTAESKKVRIANQYAALLPNWVMLNTDGLHPNYAGYELIAKTWYQTIIEITSKPIVPAAIVPAISILLLE
jgi:acyl-CoA thioesterase-1